MKPKVLITRDILQEAEKYLKQHVTCEMAATGRRPSKKEIIRKIGDKQGLYTLLVDEIDREIIDAGRELKIIANCAVGYDNIDVNYARRKGIMVTNTPGVLTETTADLTWALILATARRLPEADRYIREGKFKGWELDLFLGQEVTDKQLGIIGMGRIGRTVAKKALGFQMKVVYCDPNKLSSLEEKELRASYLSFEELLSTSDIVTIHTSLTSQTHHLISKKEFQLMKKEAILINAARGPVIDEKALAEALEKKIIWGAGLDVYEEEPKVEPRLLGLKNVVLLPHIGSASYETRLKMALTATKNLLKGLKGEKPDNLIW